jgi:hypothetical protein
MRPVLVVMGLVLAQDLPQMGLVQITLSSRWMGGPSPVMLLPSSRMSVRSKLIIAAGQPQGDHFEGHFEGQNGVGERQPESGSARVS